MPSAASRSPSEFPLTAQTDLSHSSPGHDDHDGHDLDDHGDDDHGDAFDDDEVLDDLMILMNTFPLKRCAELVSSAQFLIPAPTFGKTFKFLNKKVLNC